MSITDNIFPYYDGGPNSVQYESKEGNFTGNDMDTDVPPPTTNSVQYESKEGNFTGNDIDTDVPPPMTNSVQYESKEGNFMGNYIDTDVPPPMTNSVQYESKEGNFKGNNIDTDVPPPTTISVQCESKEGNFTGNDIDTDVPPPMTSSVQYETKEGNFTGNDIDTDVPPPTTPVIKVDNFPAPVPPSTSGKGLPYAPVDWPNPGDIWSWRVGRRISKSGFHRDRFLGLPKSLRRRNNPKYFACKSTLERFLRSLFPDADFNALFASFTWKIPAILESPPKAPAVGMDDAKKEINNKNPCSNQKKTMTPRPISIKKRQMTTNHSASVTPKRKNWQRAKDCVPPPPGFEDAKEVIDLSFLDDEDRRAEFDDYLDSLDVVLAEPSHEEPFSMHAIYDSFVAPEEMAEARMKLSSLLVMDFSSLICFKDLDELVSLARKLRKDPTLTAEQLVKLKLIEDIPSFSEVFLENKEVMEQADKFFNGVSANKAKVTSLRQEYSALKEQVTHLQSEVESSTLLTQEIEGRIGKLKSQHAKLSILIDDKKKHKDDLTCKRNLVATSIPEVVHELQVANAEKVGWELKKENAAKREAEILEKFAALKGFSL